MQNPNVAEYPNLSLIRQGVDYRFNVRLRGLTLSLRPLSIYEEDQITQEVIEEMKDLAPANQTSLKQSALLSVKKLERAQTTDVGSNDPKMYAAEIQRMTPGELDTLFKGYNAGCDKLNPTIETMAKSDLESLVAHLKKSTKDQEMTLIELPFFQLVALCRHLLSTGDLLGDR